MKTSDTPRPRLVCRMVRSWVSVIGDASAGRGLGSRHIESCEDCQSYFNAFDDLDAMLRREAKGLEPAIPSGLEQRVIRAVHGAKPERKPRTIRFFPVMISGTAACALLVALLVVRQRATVQNPASAELQSIAADQVWTTLKPKADAVLSGDPLQKEVDAMVSDARTAVRFLERNFLPNPSEQPARKS